MLKLKWPLYIALIITTSLFASHAFSQLSSSSSNKKKYKMSSAICETTQAGKTKKESIKNPSVCRLESEHRKILKWKCNGGVIKNFKPSDPC